MESPEPHTEVDFVFIRRYFRSIKARYGDKKFNNERSFHVNLCAGSLLRNEI